MGSSYYERNKEEINRKRRERRAADPEWAGAHRLRVRNSDAKRQTAGKREPPSKAARQRALVVEKQRYKDDEAKREARKQYTRDYYQANKEMIAEKQRARFADPEWATERRRKMKTIRERNPRGTKSGQLMHDYGITLDEYEAILSEQGGVCWICGAQPQSRRHPKKYLDVDHAGQKGKNAIVRGLLCNPCNVGIGFLAHDIAILESSILYLRRSANLGTIT